MRERSKSKRGRPIGEPESRTLPSRAGKVNILVVDDRPENHVTMSAILDQPDLNLVTARSGKEALRCVLRSEFAAILLDVNMPGMDGFETASLIRQRPRSAHTPIIFITAYGDDECVYKGYSLGAVDYIRTPVQPDVLRAKVAVFVDLFRKTIENQRQAEQLRRAEQKLRQQAERALADSEERFRVTFNQVAVGMALLTPEGNWIDVNQKFCDILGCSRRELKERRLRDWLSIVPEPGGRVPDPFALNDDTLDMEAHATRGDGGRIWLHLVTSVVRTASGVPKYLIAVLEDVTGRREAEHKLKALNDQLELRVAERSEALRATNDLLRRSERLASLGTLAAGIAHEINNPINAVLLSAQYALEALVEPDRDDALEQTLRDVIKESLRCGSIVKSVLHFAKEEKAPKSACQLNDIVQHAVTLAGTYTAVKDGSNCVLQAELAPSLPLLMLNATQIEQVVINLIQNAVQASGGSVSVQVQTMLRPDSVRLAITDNGPGIAPERLPHIFDPFFSTRRSQGGTGLGLSIAHGIVTDHGATIDVRSEPGRGCTFLIDFPVERPELAETVPDQTVSAGALSCAG